MPVEGLGDSRSRKWKY